MADVVKICRALHGRIPAWDPQGSPRFANRGKFPLEAWYSLYRACTVQAIFPR
jgi:hypothetical protein